MTQYQALYLKKNEERRILGGHLWIYSNEIDVKRSPLKNFSAGDIVIIHSAKDQPIAIGYINPHSLICVRVLSCNPNEIINSNFFSKKIAIAQRLRDRLYHQPYYRLIFSESDLLSGLIIDRFDDVFVVQTNTAGMEKLQKDIAESLQELFKPKAIVFKNDSSMRTMEHLPQYVSTVDEQQVDEAVVIENEVRFNFSPMTGQKTGWFYDHRENRAKLRKYVQDKTVLDVFCYLGGWGIQAAKFGAKEVYCVDASAKAINIAIQNAKLNNCNDQITFYDQDAFDALKKLKEQQKKFDVIILDPPALIKKRKDLESGTIAYLRLNELAMELLSEQGVLVSCSCSMHLSEERLIDTIRRAAIKTKHLVQIVEQGTQAMDHPIHPAIPETSYLKAIFCIVSSIDDKIS